MKDFNMKGFSLLELMIVVGLTGIVSLSSVKLMELQNKSQRNIGQNFEKQEIRNSIRNLLFVSKHCEKTFNGKTINNGTTVDEIKYENGNVLFKKDGVYGNSGTKVSISKMELAIPGSTTWITYNLSDGTEVSAGQVSLNIFLDKISGGEKKGQTKNSLSF